jgi:hypothetical protein
MSHPFDATLKEIVSQSPADFQAAFQLPATEPVTTLNVDLSTISAATDVALGFGEPLKEIVDLNFQSGPDSTVAARLHLYNASLHLKYSVPVRSVLVLLRSKASIPGLTGKMTYVSGGKRVSFEYDLIRLWKEPVHRFLEGGFGLLPLATLCKMPSGRPFAPAMREVVHGIDRRLASLVDHAHAVRLMTAAYVLANLRVPRQTLDRYYEGVRIMHQLPAYDEMILEDRMAILRSLAAKKFKGPDRKTEKALAEIYDTERVKRMIDSIFDANSWKELLSIR